MAAHIERNAGHNAASRAVAWLRLPCLGHTAHGITSLQARLVMVLGFGYLQSGRTASLQICQAWASQPPHHDVLAELLTAAVWALPQAAVHLQASSRSRSCAEDAGPLAVQLHEASCSASAEAMAAAADAALQVCFPQVSGLHLQFSEKSCQPAFMLCSSCHGTVSRLEAPLPAKCTLACCLGGHSPIQAQGCRSMS